MSFLDKDNAYAIATTTLQISTALEYGPAAADDKVEVEKEIMRTELEIETKKFLEE